MLLLITSQNICQSVAIKIAVLFSVQSMMYLVTAAIMFNRHLTIYLSSYTQYS